MADLVDRTTAVVHRYGGTVDKFTGDGIMACSARRAMRITRSGRVWQLWASRVKPGRLASELDRYDGISLQLRIGLNSGQVIAGEIGSGCIGLHRDRRAGWDGSRTDGVGGASGWGDAQQVDRSLGRAPSQSWDTELVQIKGKDEPVLRAPAAGDRARGKAWTGARNRLCSVGAGKWLLSKGFWTAPAKGRGGVVGIVGSPGIGKSRVAREVAAIAAARRGVDVFWTFAASHTSDVPFHSSDPVAAGSERTVRP